MSRHPTKFWCTYNNILGRGKWFLFNNKKGKGKKEREKCFELAEQNILIELIRKTVKKSYQIFSRDSKIYPALNLRGGWNLEQRQEIRQIAAVGERGLFVRTILSRAPPHSLIHVETTAGSCVGDWHFSSWGEGFPRLPQSHVWGKVMRAFCEQSRSELSRRGSWAH